MARSVDCELRALAVPLPVAAAKGASSPLAWQSLAVATFAAALLVVSFLVGSAGRAICAEIALTANGALDGMRFLPCPSDCVLLRCSASVEIEVYLRHIFFAQVHFINLVENGRIKL